VAGTIFNSIFANWQPYLMPEYVMNKRDWLAARRAALRWSAHYAFIVVILVCGKFEGGPFIYFQF
jgi:hypothetical protein